MVDYLKAGVAELEITGQVGLKLAAEFNSRKSTGVRTPLMAKALYLSSGDRALVIVTLDLYGLEEEATKTLKHAIAERCDIEPEAVMLGSSHTRYAPYTTPVVGGDGVAQAYIDEVIAKVPEVVVEAKNGCQKASLGIGRAELPHLIYNHRLMTRNLKAVTAWLGVPENEILKPEGPIDPEFYVIVVRDDRGEPMCLLWNFAADIRFFSIHGADIGNAFSASMPFYVQEELDMRVGRHVPALYLGGCGGNVSYTYDIETTTDAVTSAVMAVQLETPCDPVIPLDWQEEQMVLPIRDYTEFWDRPDIEMKYPEGVDAYAQELEALREEGAKAVPTRVQVFRLGPYALVGLPGMPFVEFALDLKAQSPFRETLVAGNANGHPGYVITREAFEHGGFETWTARSAKIGPGGGEFMVEEVVGFLKELADH